jgi:hypothetical protein
MDISIHVGNRKLSLVRDNRRFSAHTIRHGFVIAMIPPKETRGTSKRLSWIAGLRIAGRVVPKTSVLYGQRFAGAREVYTLSQTQWDRAFSLYRSRRLHDRAIAPGIFSIVKESQLYVLDSWLPGDDETLEDSQSIA